MKTAKPTYQINIPSCKTRGFFRKRQALTLPHPTKSEKNLKIVPGKIYTTLIPSLDLDFLRIGNITYVLHTTRFGKESTNLIGKLIAHKASNKAIYFGPGMGVPKVAFSVLQKNKKIKGFFMQCTKVTWQALELYEYKRIFEYLNQQQSQDNIEFVSPLPVSGNQVEPLNKPRAIYRINSRQARQSGGISEENFLVRHWVPFKRGPSSDNTLTPTIMQAISTFYGPQLKNKSAVLFDPMLGSGGYLHEVRKQFPCRIVVGDLSRTILDAFELASAEKYLADAQAILGILGETANNIKLTVLRGCNRRVVTQAKAKEIYSSVYKNIPTGSGLIVTGVSSVQFDSSFINAFSGAKILQNVCWNTDGALRPFYAIRKGHM